MIRVRLVAGTDLVARAIRAAQLGFAYTHAEVETPAGYLGAHASGGVAVRPIGYDAGHVAGERLLELDVEAAAETACRAYLADQLGKPYDFVAIADFARDAFLDARREGAWLEPDRWFCSELVAAALVHAGVVDRALAASARHVTPQNLAFALSPIARLVEPAPRAPA